MLHHRDLFHDISHPLYRRREFWSYNRKDPESPLYIITYRMKLQISVHSTGTRYKRSEFFLSYLFGKTLTTKIYFTPHTI